MIVPNQIRAARALLNIGQVELAKRASLAISTIKRIEAGRDEVRGAADTFIRIQQALEEAGVIFINADESAGPGVRLRGPTLSKWSSSS